MSAADLARLELAKRAYRATEPSAAEVQRGVRKARLALRRPRQRRAWFSKTLVAVVLAMGGLAYAKPQALGELVTSALQRSKPTMPKRSAGVAVTPAPVASKISEPVAAVPAREAQVEAQVETVQPGVQPVKSSPPQAKSALRVPLVPTRAAAVTDTEPVAQQAMASNWGRVGAALARGDEARALAALDELADSDDQRTRDKADLGRAQLFMANGNRDQACATARSLTNRRAGSRIERQAQVLLKSCRR